MNWRPATIDQVERIVKEDLAKCSPQHIAIFRQYAVDPYLAPIVRNEKLESVVVVARKSNEVIYWEDVEEGFNVSSTGPDGSILDHGYNQDDLGLALNRWIQSPES
jgi:hypothetical protein